MGLRKTSWSLLVAAFRFCARAFLPILAAGWPTLLGLQLLQLGADQYFSLSADVIRQRGTEDILMIALTAALEMLFGVLWSAIWLLALVPRAAAFERGEAPPALGATIARHLNQLMIEELRVLAAILLRLPLFVVPAMIEYVRLSLVSMIVIFDPAYQRGDIDALRRSRQIARGRWLLLSGLVLTTMILPWLFQTMIQGDKAAWIWENPVRVILGSLASFFINLAVGLILYAVYRGLAPETESASPPSEEPTSDSPGRGAMHADF